MPYFLTSEYAKILDNRSILEEKKKDVVAVPT